MWKHYLPATSLVDGNKGRTEIKIVLIDGAAEVKGHWVDQSALIKILFKPVLHIIKESSESPGHPLPTQLCPFCSLLQLLFCCCPPPHPSPICFSSAPIHVTQKSVDVWNSHYHSVYLSENSGYTHTQKKNFTWLCFRMFLAIFSNLIFVRIKLVMDFRSFSLSLHKPSDNTSNRPD